MRCFIAVDLPVEVREELARIANEIRKSGLLKAKFVEPENYHLTLKFLGEQPPARVEAIKNILAEIKLESFDARLGKLGVFTPAFIRVIWASLEASEIFDLHDKIDKALASLMPCDARFESHVTIARVKFVKDKQALLELLSKIRPREINFRVNSFRLKSSTLTPKGPIYHDIAVFPLG